MTDKTTQEMLVDKGLVAVTPKCDGSCEEHTDPVYPVRVMGGGIPAEGWEFNYCRNAIVEDCKRGLCVEVLQSSPPSAV
jgi:hypothetical protein